AHFGNFGRADVYWADGGSPNAASRRSGAAMLRDMPGDGPHDGTPPVRTGTRYVALSGGRRVPYPEPTTAAATRIGKGNRRTGTKPEVRLRSELHCRGRRFRKDLLIRAAGVRTHADVVFTRQRLAVFVDGCFWHCCPEHGSSPKSNTAYWEPKLRANVDRD